MTNFEQNLRGSISIFGYGLVVGGGPRSTDGGK